MLRSLPAGAPKVIQVQEPVTLAELAALLGLKPFQLIGELMKLGLFIGYPRHAFEETHREDGFQIGDSLHASLAPQPVDKAE